MAEYTTEERRNLTRSKAELQTSTEEQMLTERLDTTVASKIKEDSSNNRIFRQVNSELTGLAYEYRYLTGKFHPSLDETIYYYNDESNGEMVTLSYWDSQKLQDGAALLPGNEFHLNIREGTTIKFPIRPDKYSSWVSDIHEYVLDFETTEANLIAMVRTLDGWYTSGGGTGNVETTIFGEYFEKTPGETDDKQSYMTVGYSGYQLDPNNGYMTAGFDATGEVILINGTDPDNFAFGKIVASRDLPSRILFVPYGKAGEIPDNSDITSTYTTGQQILKLSAEQVCYKLKEFYTMNKQYLDRNPRVEEDQSNIDVYTSIINVLALFDTWEYDSTKTDFTTMLQLMTDIESERTVPLLSTREAYIPNYLGSVSSLYSDRFDIIDLRLTKNMGTLKEVMTAMKGVEVIIDIKQDREDTSSLYDNYFIVKFALQDGDYYMRIFVEESNGLNVDDWCYILTNNEDVPEIYAQITEIVNGRVIDYYNTVYDDEGNPTYAYIACKKVFFGNEIFSPEYLVTDGLRIVKEVSQI